jgi:saccharopine dehydrogenase-like NADP-dependent oxidoreductase
MLVECGLDPGIDHMLTAKLINEARAEGKPILEYRSYCGAIPSVASNTNPWQYKISWAPEGALSAFQRDVKFVENDEEVIYPGSILMSKSKPYENNFGLPLEVYPNGDAGKYKALYELSETKTLVRGSFRHQGFTTPIRAIIMLDFYGKDEIDPEMTWADYIG